MSVSKSNLSREEYPHLVFLPSGIGNLNPFFQLALMVASRDCNVTVINIQPQARVPEFTRFASLISNHPRIELLDFEIHPRTPSDANITDPFITLIESINSSLNQLNPVLSRLSVSAIFSDFAIASSSAEIASDLSIPHFIVSTTSGQFFSLVAYLPVLIAQEPDIFSNSSGNIEIQELATLPKSSIPPTWMNNSPSNYLLARYLLPNARSLSKVRGVLLNTFEWFEAETIAAFNGGRILNILPQVFPIGPLKSCQPHDESHHLSWLDEQPAESVVYVNFGSREVISTDQTRELGEGLEVCGYEYLWVTSGEFQEPLCDHFKKGKVIRGPVDEAKILAHPATGGFVNNCVWESVMWAARYGVPMLAWPQHGDQKMNADIVAKTGFGILVNDGNWGEKELVKGTEIGRLVKRMMGDLNIKNKAKIVRDKASEACSAGGSSRKVLGDVIDMIKAKPSS